MDKHQRRLVSVVIPCFNGAEYIGEAIESVLAQTYPAIELIIIDDGSTDATPAVLSRYTDRAVIVRQPNRGLSATRNAAIRLARGEYLAFLDHDDRFLPDKIAAQADLLDARPDVSIVYTGWRLIDSTGAPLLEGTWPKHEGDVLPELVLRSFAFPAAIMVRRSVVVDAGGFDEVRTGAEDWDLWLRTSLAGARWAHVDKALLEYRIHVGQMTSTDPDRRAANRMAVLDRTFADPRLPQAVRRLRSIAYHREYLRLVVDNMRASRVEIAIDFLQRAARERPAMLCDRHALSELSNLLAPLRYSRSALRLERWRAIHGPLRRLLGGLFARPDLDPAIHALRWAAWRTYARLWMRATRRLLPRQHAARSSAPPR